MFFSSSPNVSPTLFLRTVTEEVVFFELSSQREPQLHVNAIYRKIDHRETIRAVEGQCNVAPSLD